MLDKGDELKQKVESHEYWQLVEAQKILDDSERKYMESKSKRWIVAVICAMLGGVLGYFIPTLIYSASGSMYDRTNLDIAINTLLGDTRISDINTEVMIFAYSYDLQEPRFYSK